MIARAALCTPLREQASVIVEGMTDDKGDQPTIKVAITGDEMAGDRIVPNRAPDAVVGERYRLGRRIGKGGMGEVMAARDVQIARDVAIKRMRAANPSEKAIQRFLREAMVQGRLEHPAIVPVHEIGRDTDGLPYFVMKKLTGTPLAKILEDRAHDAAPARAARVCRRLPRGRVRARARRRPPRSQARQHHARRLRRGLRARLGRREDHRRRRRRVRRHRQRQRRARDARRHRDRHAGLHGARAGARPARRRRPRRRLHARLPAVRDPRRRAAASARQAGMRAALAGVDARPSHARTESRHRARARRAVRRRRPRSIATSASRPRASSASASSASSTAIATSRCAVSSRAITSTRARAAFARDSDEHRRTAMREAAGALALDPALGGAAELVGRLDARAAARDAARGHRGDGHRRRSRCEGDRAAPASGPCSARCCSCRCSGGSRRTTRIYVPALMRALAARRRRRDSRDAVRRRRSPGSSCSRTW